MIITHLNEGKKAKITLQDTILTIENKVSIDLQARQKDTQQVVDVCLDNQLKTLREGLGAWYVATIIIPARQYDLVPKEDGEEGETTQVARLLDVSGVEVRLWSLPIGYGEIVENKEITEGANE